MFRVYLSRRRNRFRQDGLIGIQERRQRFGDHIFWRNFQDLARFDKLTIELFVGVPADRFAPPFRICLFTLLSIFHRSTPSRCTPHTERN